MRICLVGIWTCDIFPLLVTKIILLDHTLRAYNLVSLQFVNAQFFVNNCILALEIAQKFGYLQYRFFQNINFKWSIFELRFALYLECVFTSRLIVVSCAEWTMNSFYYLLCVIILTSPHICFAISSPSPEGSRWRCNFLIVHILSDCTNIYSTYWPPLMQLSFRL